jgi:hypothetical protein
MSGFMPQGDAKGSQLRLLPQPHSPVVACAVGDFSLPPPRIATCPWYRPGQARLVVPSQPDGRRCSYNYVSILLSLSTDSLL